MDDLVFKNIPAEGFDPQSGFSDRVSNPTPSRNGGTVDAPEDEFVVPVSESDRLSNPSIRTGNGDMSFSGEISRLSNPTPSRKQSPVDDTVKPVIQDDSPTHVVDEFSRASNPTPTRRSANSVQPFNDSDTDVESVPNVAAIDDPYSRASNPTPTRRRRSASEVPEPVLYGVIPDVDISRASNPTPRRRAGEIPITPDTSGTDPMAFVPDKTFSRASNPTPTRRGGSAPIIPEDPSIADDSSSLSFSSVTDPYGSGIAEDSRASNPTPTRRIFGTDTAPSDDDYDDSNRLSNISPSSRK